MAGGFEVAHGGTLEYMAHEPWEYGSLGSPTLSADPLAKPVAQDRCSNVETNELSGWVEHVTKQLVDNSTDTETEVETTMASDGHPISSPALLGEFRTRKAARRNYHFDGNGDELHWSVNGIHDDQICKKERVDSTLDEQGLSLITSLLECAVAISVDNLGEAHRMLLELTQMASPYGPSCAERVVAYFAKAMASRVINSWLGICSPLINHKSVHSAFQIFNTISPFIKFAHFTSNQAILEAFHRRDRVHIIDLDIMQGLQWPALFHILSTRIEGPPHVRMTAMGASMELLVETGKQLSNFAKRLGMSFEFHPVAKKFGEINDVSVLQLRRGETLAVHWLQHSLYDSTGPDWKTLRLLKQLAPKVITMIEQDICHGGSFLDRFVGSLHYYSTLFDSLGAHLAFDDPNRQTVEHCLLYREINNVLAIGGPARSGEDKFRHWRAELARHCFLQVPMSSNAMAQAQLILNMFPSVYGYSLVQGDGTLTLGWKDTSLFTASAWTGSHPSTYSTAAN